MRTRIGNFMNDRELCDYVTGYLWPTQKDIQSRLDWKSQHNYFLAFDF